MGLSYGHVLRVEDINLWYDDVVRLLGLQHLTSSGWPDAEQCFFSTPLNACNGPKVTVDERGGVEFVHPGAEEADGFTGHATGAGSAELLLSYYDEKLADMVTEMFQPDIELFGYPTWDGTKENLQLV